MKKQHLLLHWLLLACCWLDHVHADMAAYAFLIQKLWQTFLHDWHHENQVPGKYAHLLHISCFFWQKEKNTGQDLMGILATVFVLLSHLPCPVLLPQQLFESLGTLWYPLHIIHACMHHQINNQKKRHSPAVVLMWAKDHHCFHKLAQTYLVLEKHPTDALLQN